MVKQQEKLLKDVVTWVENRVLLPRKYITPIIESLKQVFPVYFDTVYKTSFDREELELICFIIDSFLHGFFHGLKDSQEFRKYEKNFLSFRDVSVKESLDKEIKVDLNLDFGEDIYFYVSQDDHGFSIVAPTDTEGKEEEKLEYVHLFDPRVEILSTELSYINFLNEFEIVFDKKVSYCYRGKVKEVFLDIRYKGKEYRIKRNIVDYLDPSLLKINKAPFDEYNGFVRNQEEMTDMYFRNDENNLRMDSYNHIILSETRPVEVLFLSTRAYSDYLDSIEFHHYGDVNLLLSKGRSLNIKALVHKFEPQRKRISTYLSELVVTGQELESNSPNTSICFCPIKDFGSLRSYHLDEPTLRKLFQIAGIDPNDNLYNLHSGMNGDFVEFYTLALVGEQQIDSEDYRVLDDRYDPSLLSLLFVEERSFQKDGQKYANIILSDKHLRLLISRLLKE